MVADYAALVLPLFGVGCALLVVAGAAKFRSPSAARGALRAVGLTVPEGSIRALGVAEIAVGAFAAIRPSGATAAAVAVLYAAFAALVLRLVRSGSGAPCGCFGAQGPEASALHFVLNIIACGSAIAAAFAPPPGVRWVFEQRPLVAVPLVLGMAGAAFAAYLAFTALPQAWRAYGTGAS